MNQILESQHAPHISPSRASYGVSIVRIWKKWPRYNGTTLNVDVQRMIENIRMVYCALVYDGYIIIGVDLCMIAHVATTQIE